MKKKLLRIALALVLLLNMVGGIPASAASEIPPESRETISLRAEQIEYVYRLVDGKFQYRIWSYTYARWLTDWIDC